MFYFFQIMQMTVESVYEQLFSNKNNINFDNKNVIIIVFHL